MIAARRARDADMTVINLSRRLETRETAKRATSSIANLTYEQLRAVVARMVE